MQENTKSNSDSNVEEVSVETYANGDKPMSEVIKTEQEKGESTEPEQFDYNEYQDQTTTKAIADIFRILGENADKIAITNKASKEDINKIQSEVATQMMNALVENKVPDCDMKHLENVLNVTMFTLFQIVGRQKKECEMELLARSLESKDPGTGKFSREYGTLGDLFTKLIEKRKEQGSEDLSDYFNIVQDEE